MPSLLAAVLAVSVSGPITPRDLTEEVFYHIMPIAWRDSNGDAQRFGDFGGLTASLDYLEDLGVTAVWLNPIFPSPAYHGYQHGPADQLNAWFGNEAAFLDFVQQAHDRDIKVFVDFVVYGISHSSTWFQSAFNNPASPYDAWLAFTNSANTSYLGSVYNTWNGSSVGFIHWDLNDANPTALVTQWGRKWLDPNDDGDPSDGIDGYRLDHVWEQYGSGPNGWGYNLDDFWLPWKAALQSVKPEVFTFAEQADWGITGATLMPAFDSAFTKPWEFAVRDALINESTGSLYATTASTLAQMPPGRHFLGIIGDHDVDRVTSVLGGSLSKARVAAAIHMTSPFPPVIYYGDEIGMLGVKGNFGSDANDIPMREPFKWNAVAGPPMSNYWILNAAAYNARYSQNNDGRSVQEQQGVSGSLLETYRQLIAARKSHAALRRGKYIPVPNNSSRVWSFLRHQPGEETLFVAIRPRNSAFNTTFDLSATTIPGGTTAVQDVLTGEVLPSLSNGNKAAYAINMAAYSFRILAVDLEPTPPPASDIDGVDLPGSLGAWSVVATQDNGTNLGDNISELNQLFIRPEAAGLRLGLTGNLLADGTALAIFFDTAAGGQNLLNLSAHNPPPGGPNNLTGLRFDAGFVPDHMLFTNTAGGAIYVDQFTLPAGGPTVKTYRGNNTVGSGHGSLAGGANPNGMQVAMSNTNTAGVTMTDTTQAATAADGFDLFIPYADVASGGLGGSLKMAAFILRSSGSVSNQWLPGLGGGVGNLGLAPDLTTIPGDQFATIPLVIAGDINGDLAVNAADLSAFLQVLLGLDTTPARISASDLNHDGSADGADVPSFVAIYSSL